MGSVPERPGSGSGDASDEEGPGDGGCGDQPGPARPLGRALVIRAGRRGGYGARPGVGSRPALNARGSRRRGGVRTEHDRSRRDHIDGLRGGVWDGVAAGGRRVGHR
ncbi:hypothetical protein B5808_19590 (plasmid) [Cnuibacter physcomitrellae]|uniref:Uncharacterized protein n=1 Tax=Cnuibacter physcomitrellae TaxID=1619308 RepID=A0A1X9LTF1_9MICO|nr:hypothetical protein B5808_19590 [Cnuibacter physcomitrellae]